MAKINVLKKYITKQFCIIPKIRISITVPLLLLLYDRKTLTKELLISPQEMLIKNKFTCLVQKISNHKQNNFMSPEILFQRPTQQKRKRIKPPIAWKIKKKKINLMVTIFKIILPIFCWWSHILNYFYEKLFGKYGFYLGYSKIYIIQQAMHASCYYKFISFMIACLKLLKINLII